MWRFCGRDGMVAGLMITIVKQKNISIYLELAFQLHFFFLYHRKIVKGSERNWVIFQAVGHEPQNSISVQYKHTNISESFLFHVYLELVKNNYIPTLSTR